MRAIRTTKEDNLITIHFGQQEVLELESVLDEAPTVAEPGMSCEGGVCTLNWTPTKPVKKTEAA
jgi:hypothetical protein